jgi:hypothetical protein
MLCEDNCNDTSPSSVSTVNVSETNISLADASGRLEDDPVTASGGATDTLTKTFASVLGVYVGGVMQNDANYTIVGTLLTWVGTPPTAGTLILVVGIVEA